MTDEPDGAVREKPAAADKKPPEKQKRSINLTLRMES
jgi:hypothetical protein